MLRATTLALTVLCLAHTNCAPATPTLRVVLVTDLRPGFEITRTQVFVIGDDRIVDDIVTRFLPERQIGRDGVPIAFFAPLARRYRIDLTVFGASDAVIEHRVIERAADGPMTITVLLSRACLGVSCPDACHAGRCVSNACFEENPGSCGSTECRVPGDCADSGVACVEPFCSASGACFGVAVSARCAVGEICDISLGCRDPRPAAADGGARDAAVAGDMSLDVR